MGNGGQVGLRTKEKSYLNPPEFMTTKLKKSPEMNPQLFFVFDVESIGLHGQAFAVGWCVVDSQGKEHPGARYACDRDAIEGSDSDREWVDANMPPIAVTCDYPTMLEWFWADWLGWKAIGALMAADCSWPVEARFLCACVDQDKTNRAFEGPYPFIDIGSVLFAKGYDPLHEFPRRDNELPKHDPLADARQSARLLVDAMIQK